MMKNITMAGKYKILLLWHVVVYIQSADNLLYRISKKFKELEIHLQLCGPSITTIIKLKFMYSIQKLIQMSTAF